MKNALSESDLRVRTALVSVFDKTGILPFVQKLKKFDVSIITTGRTRTELERSGVKTIALDEIVRYPEMLEGRVKTLQPEIFAGILARKSSKEHMKQISDRGINSVDMVVCNFYDFETTASRKGATEQEVIEMIDIGGPSMVRAAAKNFESVCVVPSPSFYEEIGTELIATNGSVSPDTRRRMALNALGIVASYDISIYNSLNRMFSPTKDFPRCFFMSAKTFEVPKYGENPNQRALIYRIAGAEKGIPTWSQLYGDTRSYNNYLDIASSYEILEGFEDHAAAATVKHGQISGFGFSDTLQDAYRLAHGCDPEADFGNTTVLNRTVDYETARLIGKNEGSDDDGSVYTEIVLAPGYEPEALEVLKNKQKKKIRIIETAKPSNYPYEVKVMNGLVLVQEAPDYATRLDPAKTTVQSVVRPSIEDREILLGLWEVVRRVESNGVVIGNGQVSSSGKLEELWTLGVGTFRKRNGATKIALDNADKRSRGAYCASDGFFPFPDSIELLGEAGVKGIIQPGGSMNDRKVIEKADKYEMVMLFTHERAFRH